MRVSAIEALSDQRDLDKAHQDIVTELLARLDELEGSDSDKQTISSSLKNLRKQSIRSAYTRKIATLLGSSDAKKFDDLYALRGRFVHDGKGRGELSGAAASVLDIAVNLLKADVKDSP